MSAAYKLTLLLNKRAELESAVFADQLLELERSEPATATGLLKYVITIVDVADSDNAPEYDAVIETWWARKNDAADWAISREFESEWWARRSEVLADRPVAVGGQPQVALEREPNDSDAAVQVVTVVTALRKLRFDRFVEIWTDAHSTIALGEPESQQHIVRLEDTPARIAPPSQFRADRYDGIGVVAFESRAALEAETSSDYYRDQVAKHAENFCDETTVRLVGRAYQIS